MNPIADDAGGAAGGSPVPATPPAAEPAMWSLDDFRDRMVKAAERLREASGEAKFGSAWTTRLEGKAQGVDLAISYFDEMQRCDAGRFAARDTLIQAADEWERAFIVRNSTRAYAREFRAKELALRAAVGVYRTNQTPEGNPT